MQNILSIDGSQGEGGGQVLRNSISYAVILKRDIQIDKIRAGRSKPGLASQHLTGLKLACQIGGGDLEGDKLNSQFIKYDTPDLRKRKRTTALHGRCFTGDTKTAGSICLLLQVALPCALFGTPHVTKLILKGGTNASMAPQYDYWAHVFLPTLQHLFSMPPGQVECAVKSRGYYPRGGGEVHVVVQPWSKPLVPIHLVERGEVVDIYIRSFVAGKVPKHVAIDMAKAAKSVLQALCPNVLPQIGHETDKNGMGNGSGIIIVAKTTTGCLLAGSALGTPKKQAKEVGAEAANELLRSLNEGGCVDEWLQDQLILYMALANGPSQLLTGSLTLHTQTAIEIAKQVCGATIEVIKLNKSEQETIKCYGKAGLIPGKHLIKCTGINHHIMNLP